MKALKAIATPLLIAAAFAGGYLYHTIAGSTSSEAKTERRILYWYDPMHPAYKSDKPGIAPDCGMKLVPKYGEGEASDAKAMAPAEMDLAGMAPGTVQISSERQQLIGVQFAKAEMSGGSRTFRTVGRVRIDEARIGRVRAKVDGWVGDVFVNYVGQLVQRNAALMTFSSSELQAAERDLLLAGSEMSATRDAVSPKAFDQSEAVQNARRRLELWGLTPAQINQVVASGEPLRTLTVFSPVTGYVADIKATPGASITPDTDLFTIIDTSQVEVAADVFEYEIANVHLGDLARILLQALPGKAFTGRVEYIQPQVDASSPTYEVRLSMGNPGLAVIPNMYATVEFTVQVPPRLTVPADAVLDTGERKVVYVDRGEGIFEPRQVQTGSANGGRVEILAGLKAGERVAASGAFLIDSESRLKGPAGRQSSSPMSSVSDVGEK